MAEQEMCGCKACSPVLDETICSAMSHSMVRFNERAGFTANTAMDLANNVNVQFQVKGMGNLEKDRNSSSELLTLIASMSGLNNRLGGINNQN